MDFKELDLSEEELFDLLDQKIPRNSSNETNDFKSQRGQTSIEELRYWLKVLFVNLESEIDINENLSRFKEILDPGRKGKFDFSTLLTLVASEVEKLEAKAKGDEIAKNESQKYVLRPRNQIQKPKRMNNNIYEF